MRIILGKDDFVFELDIILARADFASEDLEVGLEVFGDLVVDEVELDAPHVHIVFEEGDRELVLELRRLTHTDEVLLDALRSKGTSLASELGSHVLELLLQQLLVRFSDLFFRVLLDLAHLLHLFGFSLFEGLVCDLDATLALGLHDLVHLFEVLAVVFVELDLCGHECLTGVPLVLENEQVADDDVVLIGHHHDVVCGVLGVSVFLDDLDDADDETIPEGVNAVLPHLLPAAVSRSVAVGCREVGTRVDSLAVGGTCSHEGSVGEVAETVSHDGVPVLH